MASLPPAIAFKTSNVVPFPDPLRLNLDYEEIAEKEEPLDPSKLKISTSIWDAIGQEREIIEEIKYGDEYLGIEEEDDAHSKERDGEVSWNL